MLQCGWLERRVLGFAFDGTGAGSDGAIWGGEVLLATAREYQRLAHVRPFHLPGGAVAIRQPWRVALALLDQATELGDSQIASLLNQDVQRVRQVRQLVRSPTHSLKTTSMGRLFDGVASIVCGVHDISYEGEAAIKLENVALYEATEGDAAKGINPDPPVRTEWLSKGHSLLVDAAKTSAMPAIFDWRPLVAYLVIGRWHGASRQSLAAAFHREVAAWVVRLAGEYAELPIVLAGGVFQNRLLVELIADALRERSAAIGWPGAIPPNDGGLAAGQLAIAAQFPL